MSEKPPEASGMWSLTITMHMVGAAGPRELTEYYEFDTEAEARGMEAFFAPKLNHGYFNAQLGAVATPLALSVKPVDSREVHQ